MNNFVFYNPTRIVFGKGTIAQLSELLDANLKVMITYGGGSIKQNGVYDQVMAALAGRAVVEFGGIEANPDFDTLCKAVELARREKIDFLLAVGGGSVLDGTKFIAAAIPNTGDLWAMVELGHGQAFERTIPLASVLTLPATGSEMNNGCVISWRAKGLKRAFGGDKLYPVFSILDPETTYSLPAAQTRNGIVDAYVHVMEQYCTYPVNSPLQDRQAEAVLLTLVEEGIKALKDPQDYDARANVMWAATHALNRVLSCGVAVDWATHMIGHELTALYGLAHAESLAVVLPHLYWVQREQKQEKLVQYAERVWNIRNMDAAGTVKRAIEATTVFFNGLGMPTRLSAFGVDVDEAAAQIEQRFSERGWLLGEHQDITPQKAAEIVRLSR